MSSDDESSSCSTCSGSNCCHYEDVCLNDSDIEWFREFTNNRVHKQFFYLKLLNESETINQNNDKTMQNTEQSFKSLLESDKTKPNTNERLRSSYTRLTSWMFDSKTFSNKKKSIRRKSVRKNVTHFDDKPASNASQSQSLTPSITISTCDDSNNALLNVIKDDNETSFVTDETDFIVMYLTPPNDSNEKDYLIYSYPKYNGEDNNNNAALLKLKGMFVTLSQVVSQLTNQFVRISSIAVNQQQNNEQLMTVAYVHELSSILVIALPQKRFSFREVENIIDSVSNTIKFLYNSLDSAFMNECNHIYITNLINIIRYLTEQIKYSRDYLFINTIQRLLIDDELAVMISDSLNEYEAMDWISDSSLSSQQDVSNLIVVGSCIVYKGLLIQSHLPSNYLKHIFAFLHIKGILSLQRRQSLRLVSWFEVYPISERNTESSDFSEGEGVKYYVSIVGIEHLIHCTLVEIPFLIDESNLIKTTEIIVNESIRLLKSHFTKLGLIEEIEHCFNLHEQAFDKLLNKKDDRKRHKSLSSLKDFLSISLTSSTTKQQIASSTNSLLSLDDSSVSGSSKLSYSSPSLQHSLISQTSSSATSLSYMTSKTNDSNSIYSCQHNFLSAQRYLFLPENLICYLDIEHGLQVFTGPLLQYPQDIFYQIFKKFADCCYYISAKFNIADGIDEFGKIFEIKLQYNNSSVKLKQSKSGNDVYLFYVIGCLDAKNEFYACFHTNRSSLMSSDYDIKELAYKLRFKKRLL